MEYGKNKYLPKTSGEAVHRVATAIMKQLFRPMGEMERIQYGDIVKGDNPTIAELADGNLVVIHDSDEYIFVSSSEEGGEITGEKRFGLK